MAELSQDILFDNGDNAIPQWKYAELRSSKDQLEEKYENLKLELRASEEEVRQKKRKIEFLEKLIIEKDNSQYHAVKRAKKLEKQKISQDFEIKTLKDELGEISKNFEAKL